MGINLNYQPQLVIAGLRPGAMLDFIGAFASAPWILHGILAMIFNDFQYQKRLRKLKKTIRNHGIFRIFPDFWDQSIDQGLHLLCGTTSLDYRPSKEDGE